MSLVSSLTLGSACGSNWTENGLPTGSRNSCEDKRLYNMGRNMLSRSMRPNWIKPPDQIPVYSSTVVEMTDEWAPLHPAMTRVTCCYKHCTVLQVWYCHLMHVFCMNLLRGRILGIFNASNFSALNSPRVKGYHEQHKNHARENFLIYTWHSSRLLAGIPVQRSAFIRPEARGLKLVGAGCEKSRFSFTQSYITQVAHIASDCSSDWLYSAPLRRGAQKGNL